YLRATYLWSDGTSRRTGHCRDRGSGKSRDDTAVAPQGNRAVETPGAGATGGRSSGDSRGQGQFRRKTPRNKSGGRKPSRWGPGGTRSGAGEDRAWRGRGAD